MSRAPRNSSVAFDTPSCTEVGRSPGGRRGNGRGEAKAERYRCSDTLEPVTDRSRVAGVTRNRCGIVSSSSDRSRVLVAALAGTVASALLVLLMTFGSGQGLARLIAAGEQGPAAAVVRADLPDAVLAPDVGHDGQQFYAIARAPMHLGEVAGSLDRPRYRLQRPLLPWLAWMLHPTGGGPGLIWAMFGVGAGALLLVGCTTGTLVVRSSGSPWWGAVAPLLPGAWSTLSIGGSDMLALGLALCAIAAHETRRRAWVAPAAVGAVLAKESVIVLLAGYALGHLWRWWRVERSVIVADVIPMVGAPVLMAGAWWTVLRGVPASGPQVVELVAPLAGWWEVLRRSVTDSQAVAWTVLLLAAVGLGVVAARRCAEPPWRWALIAQLGFISLLGADVLGPNLNGARSTAPLVVSSLIVLASPARRRGPTRLGPDQPEQHVGSGPGNTQDTLRAREPIAPPGVP